MKRLEAGLALLLVLFLAPDAAANYVKASVASFSSTAPEAAPDDVPGGTLVFTPASASDVWVVLISARLKGTWTGSKAAEARYLINVGFAGIGSVKNNTAGTPGSWQHFTRITGTTSRQTVQVQLYAPEGGTATIENLQMIAFRVPDNADFHFEESAWEQQAMTPGVWNDYQSLTFTPSSDGDYVIMAVANVDEANASGLGALRLWDGTGYWPVNVSGYLANGSANWQSYFLARIQTLTGGVSKTFTIQGNGSSTGFSVMRRPRIMAFRTDAFDSVQTRSDLNETSTTSTTPQLKPNPGLTTTPPASRKDHIIIQSLVLRGSHASYQRRAGFEADDVVKTNYSHAINDSSITSYGHFDALTTSSAIKYENTYSTSNWDLFNLRVYAKESVIHVLRLPTCTPQINHRSIGTNPGILHNTGTASIDAGALNPTVVNFSASLPTNIGRGDRLIFDPSGTPDEFFIFSRESDTQVTVQRPATIDHVNAPYEIRRAYNTLQDWENARGGNLVLDNRREIGVAYNDAPFLAGATIDGSTTDSCSFMWLTVAEGQRHNGTSTVGAVLDGAGTDQGIRIQDDYTILEWLSFKRIRGPVSGETASVVVQSATNVLLTKLLIYDFADASNIVAGIRAQANAGYTVRNSIIYNGDAAGIRNNDATATGVVENCTIYGMDPSGTGVGVLASAGTLSVTNTLSMGNSPSGDFSGAMTQSYNMSSDGSATGTGSRTLESAANEFFNINPGTEDLHLAASANAIGRGTDLSSSFWEDIDNQRRPAAAWDMGADEFDATTAVRLASLTARGSDGQVLLEWETASELDNLGFHLYRSVSERGPYERITAAAISGLGSSPVGAKYSYRDEGLSNGVTFYYKLEDIDTTGRTTLHGPVSATPQSGVSSGGVTDSGSEGGSARGPALITFGDPAANRFRVLERGRREAVLELWTEGFYAEPQEDEKVRISIPGFDKILAEDVPGVPVRRAWVEALAGRRVEISSVQTSAEVWIEGLHPSEAEWVDIEASQLGTVRTVRRARSRGVARPESLRTEANGIGLYPAQTARIVTEGFQGEVKKALVELAPLRWDATTLRWLLTRRLVVRLSFAGREPLEHTLDGVHGRRPREEAAQGREPAVLKRLVTVDPGLYEVSYDDLFGRTSGSLPATSLRLNRLGRAVAFHIEPDQGRFGPGSRLYFLSQGAKENPYGKEAVYELEVGAEGMCMEVDSAAPSGKGSSFYWETLQNEENRLYQAGLLNAEDVWLWDSLLAPVVKSYGFVVNRLAPSSESSRLTVWLQGASDFPADPDHHVRLYVNGIQVTETLWNGKRPQSVVAELMPGSLKEGENRLDIENVGDTEARYSMVLLDRFEVDYPRHPVAEGGELGGVWGQSGMTDVMGVGSPAYLLETTDEAPRWLTGGVVSPEGDFQFRAEAGRSYLIVGEEAVGHPVVRTMVGHALRSSRQQADYLVVGPRAFLDEARPLRELRQSQGLRVKAVAMEDVFEEFGFGESRPEAVRDFLSYAYHRWREPSIRYVLLLGDATYDFKDYLGTGVENHVSPLLVKTSFLWTVSDPTLAAVNGEDGLPDLAIGRLPASSVAEVRTMVEKIVSYEMAEPGPSPAIVLVADNPDQAGNFVEDAEEIASEELAGANVHRLYLSELGVAATRTNILKSFNEGASLLSYLGHGGIHLWADENLLDIWQVEGLEPQPQQPLVLTMNCLNGYFHFPYFDSLAEALVKANGKGAIAAFSPSGLSLNAPAQVYHKALVRELYRGGHHRLGDAVLAAQADYADTGLFPELLSIYHLLGDPALVLR